MGVELNGRSGLVPENYFEVLYNTAVDGGQMEPPAVTVSVANDGQREREEKSGYSASAALESNSIYAVPRPRSQYMNMDEADSTLKERAPADKTARTSQHLAVEEVSDIPQSEYMNFEAVEAALMENDGHSMVGKVVKVLYSWSGLEDNQLHIKKDQVISIVEEKENWCMGIVGGKVRGEGKGGGGEGRGTRGMWEGCVDISIVLSG